ncbi:hypothetical protein DY000_02023038 [Brassica cretica]|uniref:CASP-like protein n=1 Tax=Brassica cretica TaxID=69181 RepID=A0ABQ7EKG9_BRACR|nr:hypothetical protein DY000_02023038 [Brassica cretica]
MVVYPAQTIFLSIVGCKLLQLMRKGFTWKLECISSQVANEAGYSGIAFLDSFFILFASYTDSLYAGARIMEKKHSNMIFKIFFAFTIAAAAISHLISLSPDYSKATNAAASSKIASEEEHKMWINGEPSDLR